MTDKPEEPTMVVCGSEWRVVYLDTGQRVGRHYEEEPNRDLFETLRGKGFAVQLEYRMLYQGPWSHE